MLTLRYHLISLVAVFLALAVGVVLGSTTVSQRLLSVVAGDRGALTQDLSQATVQRDQLLARQRASDAFATAVAPGVVAGQLSGRTVALVVAPGADAADRDALRALVSQAGGSVSGEVDLTDAVTDPARADQVRDLTTRLLPAGAQLPTVTDAGGLVGGLLGSVLLTRPNGQAVASDQAAAALAGLTQAGFVVPGPRPSPGKLALVLTGGELTGPNAAERAAAVARLATELDHAGSGAVLAGRAGTAGPTGAVGVARADTGGPGASSGASALSSVDDADTAMGRVATVLALREQADGRAGRYGAESSAQAPVPAGGASTVSTTR